MQFSRRAVMALAAFAVTAGIAAAGPVEDAIKARGHMVVATNANWPPQGFLNEQNELVGFDIDVARAIGEKLGYEVKFETPDWQVMTGGRWNGRFDLGVGSVTPTKARAQVLDFPAVYYYSPYVLVVHKDSTAKTADDLKGKVIGVETATTSEDYINRRLEIDAPDAPPIEYILEPGEVKTYANSMLPFDDLRLGDGTRLDAIIAPEQTADGAIKAGYPVRKLEGVTPFKEPLVVIADKTDPEWTARVKAAVEALRADGTLATLTQKWYGADYSQ